MTCWIRKENQHQHSCKWSSHCLHHVDIYGLRSTVALQVEYLLVFFVSFVVLGVVKILECYQTCEAWLVMVCRNVCFWRWINLITKYSCFELAFASDGGWRGDNVWLFSWILLVDFSLWGASTGHWQEALQLLAEILGVSPKKGTELISGLKNRGNFSLTCFWELPDLSKRIRVVNKSYDFKNPAGSRDPYSISLMVENLNLCGTFGILGYLGCSSHGFLQTEDGTCWHPARRAGLQCGYQCMCAGRGWSLELLKRASGSDVWKFFASKENLVNKPFERVFIFFVS